MWRRISLGALIALMGGSGVAHLVAPEPYARIVPRWLPAPQQIVFWSGVAELALAAGLAYPRTRRAAGLATMAFLVAVYPGNIQHALDARAGTAEWWITRARLPLQPVLIWWAWTVARASARRRSAPRD